MIVAVRQGSTTKMVSSHILGLLQDVSLPTDLLPETSVQNAWTWLMFLKSFSGLVLGGSMMFLY